MGWLIFPFFKKEINRFQSQKRKQQNLKKTWNSIMLIIEQ